MSEEKSASMSLSIGERVRNYIFLYASIILFIVWNEEFMHMVTQSRMFEKGDLDFAQKFVVSIATVLGALSVIILNVGRDMGLHIIIDELLFHVRKKVKKIIVSYLREAAKKIAASGHENMEHNEDEVMFLFWHFINKEKALKDQAFKYWQQYYVNIYIVFFGLLSFAISTALLIERAKMDIVGVLPLFIIAIVLSVGESTRSMLLRRVYEIPIQQIREIPLDELKAEVERRFVDYRNDDTDNVEKSKAGVVKLAHPAMF